MGGSILPSMPETSEHRDKSERTQPKAVAMAREALVILAAEDAPRAALVAKLLPTYAVQLEKDGVALDVGQLVEAGRKGADFLKGARRKRVIPPKQSKSYEEIFANLPLCNAYEGMSRDNQFIIACYRGDLAHVKKCMEYNTNVHFGDDVAMTYAAYAGNLDIIRLLHAKGVGAGVRNNEPLFEAVSRGYLDVAQWLVAHGADVRASNSYAAGIAVLRDNLTMLRWLEQAGADIIDPESRTMLMAAGYNNLPMLKYLHAKGGDLAGNDGNIIKDAVYAGNIEMLEWIEAQGIDFADPKFEAGASSGYGGDLKIMQFLYDRGVFSSQEILNQAVVNTAFWGHKKAFYKLIEWGADIRANNDEALFKAANRGHLHIVKILCKMGADVNSGGGVPLMSAVAGGHYEVQAYLHRRGARIDVNCAYLREQDVFKELKDTEYPAIARLLIEGAYKNVESYIKNRTAWRKMHGIWPLAGVEHDNPALYVPDVYQFVMECMVKEKQIKSLSPDTYEDKKKYKEISALAFVTAQIFQTRGRVTAYFERWGRAQAQPLYELIKDIYLPSKAEICVQSWGDAIIKCGPSMARLVQHAHYLEKPMKNAGGTAWSMICTRDAVAPHAYHHGMENPELARICLEHDMNQDSFDKALAVIKEAPPAQKNLPDLAIQGEKFGMKGARLYRLPANDVRGLYLGQYTDCCQYVGENGEACAIFGYKSPESGFYVIENARGQIIAQSWAWRGADGALCFDSLETLGHNVPPEKWPEILKAIADHLDEDPARGATPVTRFVVGAGGDTPANTLSAIFKKAAKPSSLPEYDGYSDAKQQFLIWRRAKTSLPKTGRAP